MDGSVCSSKRLEGIGLMTGSVGVDHGDVEAEVGSAIGCSIDRDVVALEDTRSKRAAGFTVGLEANTLDHCNENVANEVVTRRQHRVAVAVEQVLFADLDDVAAEDASTKAGHTSFSSKVGKNGKAEAETQSDGEVAV